jgi:hypothetical protein
LYSEWSCGPCGHRNHQELFLKHKLLGFTSRILTQEITGDIDAVGIFESHCLCSRSQEEVRERKMWAEGGRRKKTKNGVIT